MLTKVQIAFIAYSQKAITIKHEELKIQILNNIDKITRPKNTHQIKIFILSIFSKPLIQVAF